MRGDGEQKTPTLISICKLRRATPSRLQYSLKRASDNGRKKRKEKKPGQDMNPEKPRKVLDDTGKDLLSLTFSDIACLHDFSVLGPHMLLPLVRTDAWKGKVALAGDILIY